jgi:flavin-binding protein dodecin
VDGHRFGAITTNRPVRGSHQGESMSVAKVTEISASSEKSFEDAVQVGIARASKTLHGIKGAWIKEQSIVVNNNAIAEYRVSMKVTFVLE